jgi:hypothetical protein
MSEMFIRVPSPVTVEVTHHGSIECSLNLMIAHLVDHHPTFQYPASHARAGARILAASDAVVADVIGPIRPEDWQLLRDAAESSAVGYAALAVSNKEDGSIQPVKAGTRFFVPLIDAIALAVTVDPRI